MSPFEIDTIEVVQSRLNSASRALAGFRSLLEAAQGNPVSADGLLALIGSAVDEVGEAARELNTVVH